MDPENLRLNTIKVTGNSDSSGWSQIFSFEAGQGSKDKGKIFVIISSSGSSGGIIEETSKSREIVSGLSRSYFGSSGLTHFEALKKAAAETFEKHKNTEPSLEICALLNLDNVVFISLAGGGIFWRRKKETLTKIIEGGNGNEVKSASGYIKAGDVFLLTTAGFNRLYEENDIKDALEAQEFRGFSEKLAVKVKNSPRAGRCAALMFEASFPKPIGLEIRKIDSKPQHSFSATAVNDSDGVLPTADFPAKPPAPSLEPRSESDEKMLSDGIPAKKLIPGFLKKSLLPGIFQKKSLYVKAEPTELAPVSAKRRISITVGLFLLVGLIGSITLGIREKKVKDYKNSYLPTKEAAEHNINEADKLFLLDPDKSRELFASGISDYKKLEGMGIPSGELKSLADLISVKRGKILGVYDQPADLFLDLSLLSQGFSGGRIKKGGESVFVSDSEGKRVVKIGIEGKRSEVVLGPGKLGEVYDLTADDKNLFVLTDSGIYGVNGDDTKQETKEGDAKFSVNMFNGNLYVFDSASGKIWKYTGGADKFSEAQLWSESEADKLKNASSWAIDGSLWFLNGGTITKLVQGKPQSFSVTDVIPELTVADRIFTDPDQKSLYILDKAGKRLVVLGKDGKYVAQYAADELGNASEIIVSEARKKALFLAGEKLYSIELRHLE